MIKSSKFLIFSFLATSILSLQAMEETENLPKKTVANMIIKYQSDETTYLVQLLSLPRETIQNKITESIKSEVEEHSKCKDDQDQLTITQNHLKEMTFLIEALYLIATTKDKINENKKLYRQLSLKFHPDKLQKFDKQIQEEKSSFFTTLEPLLGDDKSNNHLNNIVKTIREKRNEIIDQINNPSISTYAAHFFCSTALPTIGHGLGIALCHKTFSQIMPRSADENILSDICVANARRTALDIETKLVKIPHHP